jgi:hypothetical protein
VAEKNVANNVPAGILDTNFAIHDQLTRWVVNRDPGLYDMQYIPGFN